MILPGGALQEIVMDREFAFSVAIALFLAVTVKILTPAATAAGVDLAQSRTENALSAQSDMSWLVSP
jgi:hypothetical protein